MSLMKILPTLSWYKDLSKSATFLQTKSPMNVNRKSVATMYTIDPEGKSNVAIVATNVYATYTNPQSW